MTIRTSFVRGLAPLLGMLGAACDAPDTSTFPTALDTVVATDTDTDVATDTDADVATDTDVTDADVTDTDVTDTEVVTDTDVATDTDVDTEASCPTYYADTDDDGYGDPAASVVSCTPLSGHVLDGSDCDDGDGAVHREVLVFADADRDGHVARDGAVVRCVGDALPPGWFETAGDDCGDADPFVYTGAAERPDDGVDQDCDDQDLVRSDAIGVFVAPGGTGDGTMAAPLGELAPALQLAAAHGKAVFLASGTWVVNATTAVSMHGAYSGPPGWTRDLAVNQTVLDAASAGAALTAMGGAAPPILIDSLVVRGGTHPSTEAVRVADGATVIIGSCTIRGGVATDPEAGSVGIHALGPTTVVGSDIDGGTAHQPFGIIAAAPLTIAHSSVLAGESDYLAIGVQAYASLDIVTSIVDGGMADTTFAIELRTDTAIAARVTTSLLLAGTGDQSGCLATVGAARVQAVDTVFSAPFGQGAMVQLYYASQARLVHDVFWPAQSGRLLLAVDGGSATSPDDLDACAWPGCLGAGGTRVGDPKLSADGHIASDSACRDAGIDPGELGTAPIVPGYGVDRDGALRPSGAAWDVGPDELP